MMTMTSQRPLPRRGGQQVHQRDGLHPALRDGGHPDLPSDGLGRRHRGQEPRPSGRVGRGDDHLVQEHADRFVGVLIMDVACLLI